FRAVCSRRAGILSRGRMALHAHFDSRQQDVLRFDGVVSAGVARSAIHCTVGRVTETGVRQPDSWYIRRYDTPLGVIMVALPTSFLAFVEQFLCGTNLILDALLCLLHGGIRRFARYKTGRNLLVEYRWVSLQQLAGVVALEKLAQCVRLQSMRHGRLAAFEGKGMTGFAMLLIDNRKHCCARCTRRRDGCRRKIGNGIRVNSGLLRVELVAGSAD